MSGSPYAITGVLSNGAGTLSNYNVTLTDGALTVKPFAFTYVILNDSQTYGSPANFATDLGTIINTGINGENLDIAYSSTGDTAVAHVAGSPYAITGVLSNGTGTLSDYNVTLTDGALTVKPFALTYAILNDSQTHGKPANFVTDLGTTINTGVNGENLDIAYSSIGDTATASVGPYSITGTLSNGTGLLSNYNVTLTSGKLTVKPGPATQISVNVFPPNPIVADTAFNFTLSLFDDAGDIATGYTGTLIFRSSDSGAMLPSNYTFTAADNGSHTFSVTMETSGGPDSDHNRHGQPCT